jgi:hypothetical protein
MLRASNRCRLYVLFPQKGFIRKIAFLAPMKLFLLILLLVPAAMALDSDTQVVLGSGDNALANNFVTVADPSEVDTSGDVLVIGGPCANPLWEQYAGMTCEDWPYAAGDGVILSLQSGRVTLIAGTTPEDTQRLVAEFLDDTSGTSTTSTTTSTSGQYTITQGESQTLTTSSGSVFVSGLVIDGSTVGEVMIDGDRFTNLAEGRTIVTDDEVLIRIISIGVDTITISVSDFSDDDEDDSDVDTETLTLGEGDTETVSVGDEDFTVEDLSIDADAETIDITIDGRRG